MPFSIRNVIFLGVAFLFSGMLSLSVSNAQPEEDYGNLEVVQEGLDNPSNLAIPPDGSGRIFLMEHHTGAIRVLQNGHVLPEAFLDLGDLLVEEKFYEIGLIGMAFPPGFPEKKHVYVTYTNRKNQLVLSRFQVNEETTQAMKSSEEVLIETETLKPYHHCGHVTFGVQDPYLYLCVGDADNRKNSQNLKLLQGSILRLDVDSPEKPYAIPPDNPFAGSKEIRPEIWAYGLRNPWRFGFDSETGDLFIPDVGDFGWEEINFRPSPVEGGQDFGWYFYEGKDCLRDCEGKNPVWPIFEYPHGEIGCAVIGGEVYQGDAFPDWRGVYVFSDHCSGEVWAIRNARNNPQIRLIIDPKNPAIPNAITAGPDGELLLADRRGRIFRIDFPGNFRSNWQNIGRALINRQAAKIEALKESNLLNQSIKSIGDLIKLIRQQAF